MIIQKIKKVWFKKYHGTKDYIFTHRKTMLGWFFGVLTTVFLPHYLSYLFELKLNEIGSNQKLIQTVLDNRKELTKAFGEKGYAFKNQVTFMLIDINKQKNESHTINCDAFLEKYKIYPTRIEWIDATAGLKNLFPGEGFQQAIEIKKFLDEEIDQCFHFDQKNADKLSDLIDRLRDYMWSKVAPDYVVAEIDRHS